MGVKRQVYVWDRARKEVVPIEERTWKPVNAPYVISDLMPDTWHPAADRYFDSKSAFRQATKACGCVEVGNDLMSNHKRDKIEHIPDHKLVDKIERAWQQLKS